MSEIDYTELDYTKMIANPMVVPDSISPEIFYSQIFGKYKRFIECPQIPGVDRKKIFRYIPLVYDEHSPLHSVIDNIKKLKGKAADLAGFKKDEDGKYHENVEKMLSCQIQNVNFMIIQYVVLHKSSKYHRLVVLNEMNFNVSERLLRTQETKEIKAFEDLGDRIDSLKQDLLSKDGSQTLENDLDEYYFADQLQLRPEDIARKRAEGLPLV